MFDNGQPQKASTWDHAQRQIHRFGPSVELIMEGKCIPSCCHSCSMTPPSLSGVLEVNVCALAPEAWIHCVDSLTAGMPFHKRNQMGCLASHAIAIEDANKCFAMICPHYAVTHLKPCLLPFFQPSWKFAENDAWKTSKCTDIFGTAQGSILFMKWCVWEKDYILWISLDAFLASISGMPLDLKDSSWIVYLFINHQSTF